MIRASAVVATALAFVCLCASLAFAGDDAALGERDTREMLRTLGETNEQSRTDLCARLWSCTNARWAATTSLECVEAAEDRLQKAVAERDKQGAKMFSFFVSRVARDFENRAKFTEYRVMEIENRTLCGTVQEWTRSLGRFQEAARTATARVSDPEGTVVVADRARRLLALGRRASQQAAVLSTLRGGAVGALVAELHAWAGPRSDRELAVAAMRELTLVPDLVDAEKLRGSATGDDPVVRRVAFRLLAMVGNAAAMDILIERIQVEEGVPAYELARYLYNVTGESLGLNRTAWRDWWQAHREGWRRRPDLAVDIGEIERVPYSRYFGLELKSARVLFLLDRSGSMSWGIAHKAGADDDYSVRGATKMDVATRELITAVQGLDDRTSFNILDYGTNFGTFQRRPVRATQENREKAARWIAKLVPDGQTNLAGSLLAALEHTRAGTGSTDDAIADTIVVLTDGAPNCGPLAYAADTLAELRRLNPDKMVTIHAIFLGVDGDEAFMRSLAEDHGGQFIHHKK